MKRRLELPGDNNTAVHPGLSSAALIYVLVSDVTRVRVHRRARRCPLCVHKGSSVILSRAVAYINDRNWDLLCLSSARQIFGADLLSLPGRCRSLSIDRETANRRHRQRIRTRQVFPGVAPARRGNSFQRSRMSVPLTTTNKKRVLRDNLYSDNEIKRRRFTSRTREFKCVTASRILSGKCPAHSF